MFELPRYLQIYWIVMIIALMLWAVLNYCINDKDLNMLAALLMVPIPICLFIGFALTYFDLEYIDFKEYFWNRVILFRVIGIILVVTILLFSGYVLGIQLSMNDVIKERYGANVDQFLDNIFLIITLFIMGFAVLTSSPLVFKIIEIAWGLGTLLNVLAGLLGAITGESIDQFIFGIHITSYFGYAVITAIVAFYARFCWSYLVETKS